jgi:FKBP-type peptidyl-prolyl cis-trans isomerase (trigger factor)
MEHKKGYERAEIKKLPDSGVEIAVEVSFETLSSYRGKALAKLKEAVALPGFRKGKVPEKIITEQIGEMGVLQEAAELLVNDVYRQVIEDHKLDIVGTPKISITKLAPGNPLQFTITGDLFPVFNLPDYTSLAKEVLKKQEPVFITEKETENIILEVRKTRGTKKENGEEELPELTDDLVKTIGPFQSVDDFKKKITENLTKEKEFRAKEKRRLEIIGEIIKKSDISVPKILIESELDRMFAQFGEDVKRRKTSVSEYLTKIKKTESILRGEWRKDAETRVKFELILDKIGADENIYADEKEVEQESKHIIEHYSGADTARVREYVSHQLRNEAVFQFLENQK